MTKTIYSQIYQAEAIEAEAAVEITQNAMTDQPKMINVL